MIMIQLTELWREILEQLISLQTTISALVMITFLQLLCLISNARNTQVVARSTHTPNKPRKSPSLFGKIRRRLRPSPTDRLPEGDKKELTDK